MKAYLQNIMDRRTSFSLNFPFMCHLLPKCLMLCRVCYFREVILI
nr:MAG TPA: hypothetical protein [Bacteriophage sp.]